MASTSAFYWAARWAAPQQQAECASATSSTRSSFEDFRPQPSFSALEAAELLTRLQHAQYPEPAAKPPAKRGGKASGSEQKVCMDCGRTETCFWRRDRETRRPLCNACGLYFAKHKFHRGAKLADK